MSGRSKTVSNPDLHTRMLWLVAVALLCTTQITEGTNPGMKLQLNQAGLHYVCQFGIEAFMDLWNTAAMNSSNQTQEIQIPQSAVSLVPGTGASLSISNANIKVTRNWNKSCCMCVSASDVSGSSVIEVKRGAGGLPSLSNTQSNFKIGSLRVTVRGGESCLNNRNIKAIEHQVKRELTDQLNKAYQEAITNLDDIVKTMKIFAEVKEVIGIDYSLINQPTITNQNIELDCKGEFDYLDDCRDPPFSPAPLSFPEESDRMIYVGITESYVNSAAQAYYSAGLLQMDVNISEVMKDQGISFTTENFKAMLPEVPKRYPNKMVVIQMAVRKWPVVTFLPGEIAFMVYGSYWAYAELSHSELAPIFSVDMDVKVNVNVAVLASELGVDLALGNFSFSNVSSSFGHFEIEQARPFLTTLLENIVVPKVNENLSGGFPLPTFRNLLLENSMLTFHKGHALISTDLQYSR